MRLPYSDIYLCYNMLMSTFIAFAAVVFFLFVILAASSDSGSPQSIGEAGEATVSHRLHMELDEHKYKILNNIMLRTNRGVTTQIDHVVVSQYGVFVIETKNMSGWIFASEKGRKWTMTLPNRSHDRFWNPSHKYHFQNPLRQNYLHVATLAYHLNIPKHHIHSLVAFPDETEFKRGYPSGVFTYSRIADAVKSFETKVFDVKTTRSIAESITATNAGITPEERDKHVERIRLTYSS